MWRLRKYLKKRTGSSRARYQRDTRGITPVTDGSVITSPRFRRPPSRRTWYACITSRSRSRADPDSDLVGGGEKTIFNDKIVTDLRLVFSSDDHRRSRRLHGRWELCRRYRYLHKYNIHTRQITSWENRGSWTRTPLDSTSGPPDLRAGIHEGRIFGGLKRRRVFKSKPSQSWMLSDRFLSHWEWKNH